MDTLAHFLWTIIIFHRYDHLGLALIFGILPDVCSWGIYMFYSIFKDGFRKGPPKLNKIPNWAFMLYKITHSIIIILIIFIMTFIITKQSPYYLLAWIIHIVMDIPMHSRAFLPTPFLWPVSDWTFPGFSWGNKKFMMGNYSLIALAIVLIIILR